MEIARPMPPEPPITTAQPPAGKSGSRSGTVMALPLRRRGAQGGADRAVEMNQRRFVAAVDHLFGDARFEADLHALAQREILLHHRADGDIAVLLPIGIR